MSANNDYILLIMNCKKYEKKALFQKQTWLPLLSSYLHYYHVIGDDTMDQPYKFDDSNNILWVKTADDYNSLPKKVIASYQAVYESFNFKYIFKTDDDQVLVKPQFFDILKQMLETKKTKSHYGGHIVDVKQNYLSDYSKIHPELPEKLPILQTKYCSGRFYFLSKNAVINLLMKKEKIAKEYLEDYAIGYNLDPIYKQDILSLVTTNFFKDIELTDFQKLVEEGKI